jgi:hypothetical protein
MKLPNSSKVALTACGTETFNAVCSACLGASTDRGPISSADSPPARWLDATCDRPWPTSFRSSVLRPGATSAAGRLINWG